MDARAEKTIERYEIASGWIRDRTHNLTAARAVLRNGSAIGRRHAGWYAIDRVASPVSAGPSVDMRSPKSGLPPSSPSSVVHRIPDRGDRSRILTPWPDRSCEEEVKYCDQDERPPSEETEITEKSV